MTRLISILTIAWISFLSLALTGCSTGFGTPPKGSPTMSDAYGVAARGDTVFYGGNGNTRNINRTRARLPKLSQNTNNSNQYASVLDAQFPKLANPQNLMYIFGHYADGGEVPVPGHFVTFAMYDKDHYALPQEIQKPYNDGQFNKEQKI